MPHVCPFVTEIKYYCFSSFLRIDGNLCSVYEEITSSRLYTPCNPRSGLTKDVYNLIEIISNEPNK